MFLVSRLRGNDKGVCIRMVREQDWIPAFARMTNVNGNLTGFSHTWEQDWIPAFARMTLDSCLRRNDEGVCMTAKLKYLTGMTSVIQNRRRREDGVPLFSGHVFSYHRASSSWPVLNVSFSDGEFSRSAASPRFLVL